jgi:hypothetical protein
VLGQPPGDNEEELMKQVKIGDLSMGTDKVTVHYREQPAFAESAHGPPEGRFSTAWVVCDLGFFRVDVTVIGPKPEKAEDGFPFGRAQTQAVFQAIADAVVLLKKELR